MKIFTNFNLKEFNSYRVRSICRKAYFPTKVEDILYIFNHESKTILLGSGHNVLLSKDYYDEAFVIFSTNFQDYDLHLDGKIEVNAGMFTKELAEIAYNNSLTGFEVFYDIPSSIGGGIVMNAGANGEEIGGIVESVKCLDLYSNSIVRFNKDECAFTYRNSLFQSNKELVVLSAVLQLRKGVKEDILHKMNLIKEQRFSKQPKEFPNAGSVFKRPEGRFVGPMLDELNLKGFTIGGAQISEKHSGFIVNVNDATGLDILNLIKEVSFRVKDHFNIDLEVEQRII